MKRKAAISILLISLVALLVMPAGFAASRRAPTNITGHWEGTYTSDAGPVYGLVWDIKQSGQNLTGTSVLTLPDGNIRITVKSTPGIYVNDKVVLTSEIVLHVLKPFFWYPTDMTLSTTNDLDVIDPTHMTGRANMKMIYWVIYSVADEGSVALTRTPRAPLKDGDLLGEWKGCVQSRNPHGTYSAYMNVVSDSGGVCVAEPLVLETSEIKVVEDHAEGTHTGNDVTLEILVELDTVYAGHVKLDIDLAGTLTKAVPSFILSGNYTIIATFFEIPDIQIDEGTWQMHRVSNKTQVQK